MALGDQIAQNLVERRKIKDLDFIRTAQFGCIGLFLTVSKFDVKLQKCLIFIYNMYDIDLLKLNNAYNCKIIIKSIK